MLYHEDPQTNEIILTVINDGDGSQCGSGYERRCDLARAGNSLTEFRFMAREYIRHAHRTFGTPHPPRSAWVGAGNYLQRYYEEHITE